MSQDIQEYFPGLRRSDPITISASHVVGLSNAVASKTIAPLSSGFVADYYTDGIADDVQFQQAIDAVNILGGGTIFLRAGTYNLSTTVRLRSNLTISGEGEGTVVNMPTTASIGNRISIVPGADLWEGVSNIKIANFKCVAQSQTTDEFLIGVYNCQNIEITGMHMEARGGFALFFGNYNTSRGGTQDTAGVWVHHNYLRGNCQQDIVGGGPNFDSPNWDWRDVTIESNFLIHDATLSGAATHYNCIDLVAVSSTRFISNTCAGTLYFGNERVPHQYSEISNNIVKPAKGTTTARSGITVQSENNTTAQSGKMLITGNIVYGGGIHVSGNSTYPILSTDVVGNVVVGNSALTGNDQTSTLAESGILLQNATNCLVSGNYCDGTLVTDNKGIVCSDASNNSIVGNYVKGFTHSFGEGGTAGSNQYVGNYITGYSAAAVNAMASSDIIRNNFGYATEASGTATVANGATTAVVTHGLGVTPVAGNIMVTPTNATTNDIVRFYIDTYTSTQFTIHVGADPGASGATFAWLARI